MYGVWLQVEVLEAREIPRMDKMGTSDPSVRIFTDPKRRVETGTKKNTLNPVWENEVFYLMVQVLHPPTAVARNVSVELVPDPGAICA